MSKKCYEIVVFIRLPDGTTFAESKQTVVVDDFQDADDMARAPLSDMGVKVSIRYLGKADSVTPTTGTEIAGGSESDD